MTYFIVACSEWKIIEKDTYELKEVNAKQSVRKYVGVIEHKNYDEVSFNAKEQQIDGCLVSIKSDNAII